MEGRCKDCVFWTALNKKWSSYQEYEYETTQGDCSCEKFVYNKEEPVEKANDEFLYVDDCNNGAWFNPCSHFGCIHFKARP